MQCLCRIFYRILNDFYFCDTDFKKFLKFLKSVFVSFISTDFFCSFFCLPCKAFKGI